MIKSTYFSTMPMVVQSKVLLNLNSCDSPETLTGMVQKRGTETTFRIRDAKRILLRRMELKEFDDLRQVAVVAGIGAGKIKSIVQAMS